MCMVRLDEGLISKGRILSKHRRPEGSWLVREDVRPPRLRNGIGDIPTGSMNASPIEKANPVVASNQLDLNDSTTCLI